MTDTGMGAKRKIVSLSAPTEQPPAQKSSPGWYKLYNDTDMYVSVYRQEWDQPKSLFILAPGQTSSEYEAGHEIYILWITDVGTESTPITWDSSGGFSCEYVLSGYTQANQVNNVSSFQ
ncbi:MULTISPECIES: hypothetical protein [unclassified Nocardia]|uniref:hypothetical protein n=1 Tax=Nocardia sp. NPDC047038 TaxID=3154338 RepID=UPI0033FE985E